MTPPDRKPIVESLQDLVHAVSQLVEAVAATANSARQIVEPIREARARHKAARKAPKRRAAKREQGRRPRKRTPRKG